LRNERTSVSTHSSRGPGNGAPTGGLGAGSNYVREEELQMLF
jgi:hypothetical protein